METILKTAVTFVILYTTWTTVASTVVMASPL